MDLDSGSPLGAPEIFSTEHRPKTDNLGYENSEAGVWIPFPRGWERLKIIPPGQTVRVPLASISDHKTYPLDQKKHFPICLSRCVGTSANNNFVFITNEVTCCFWEKNSQQIQLLLEYSPKSDHWAKLLEEDCALSYKTKQNKNHESFKLKMGNFNHNYVLNWNLIEKNRIPLYSDFWDIQDKISIYLVYFNS